MNFNLWLRNRYVLCGLGITTTYFIFTALQVNHFVSTVFRGEQYYVYYVSYLPILYVFFCLSYARSTSFSNVRWSLLFGTFAGYVAGLIAYFAVVFSMGSGLERISNSATDLRHALLMLTLPFVYLSWVYGATAALIVYLIKKKLAK